MKQPAADQMTYREAYAALSRAVEQLEGGSDELDLDKVLPLLEEARAAYEVCRRRIAAVQTTVQETAWLQGGAEEEGAQGE